MLGGDPTHRLARLSGLVAAVLGSQKTLDTVQHEAVIIRFRYGRPVLTKIRSFLDRARNRSGEDYAWTWGAIAYPMRESESALVFSADIDKHDVNGTSRVVQYLFGFYRIGGFQHLITALAEIFGERCADQDVAVDNEDACVAHAGVPGGATPKVTKTNATVCVMSYGVAIKRPGIVSLFK